MTFMPHLIICKYTDCFSKTNRNKILKCFNKIKVVPSEEIQKKLDLNELQRSEIFIEKSSASSSELQRSGILFNPKSQDIV